VDTQRIGSNLYYKFDQYRGHQDVLLSEKNQKFFRQLDTTTSLWYDFGADTGASWTAKGNYGVQWTVYLVSQTDTVMTPAGRFTKCYHFAFTGVPDNDWDEWFAQGVGVVKRHFHGFAFNEWLLLDDQTTSIFSSNKTSGIRTYKLFQNYPNPFNPSTTIEFDLPKSSEVSLKVFNILGEEVTALVSERLSTGSYSYEWDAGKLASGVYLYRVQAGNFVETRKMVLMR
jgi:hypothetical protein